MTQKTQVTIKVIDDKSPYLEKVIALGDANKATLGFLSKGAFYDHAARRQIIIALDSQVGFMGYLLYRSSQKYERITIIHLSIDPTHRRKKLTRKLVDYLIEITQQYSGIGLTCRRDYGLDNMWSKLGFVPQYSKQAKTQGKELTYWWLDYGKPNLISSATTDKREQKLFVVIDINIFFDFYDEENNKNDQSKSLLADWLESELNLCLTDAIFNKINTIANLAERNKFHNLAKNFTSLTCQPQMLDTVYQSLTNFLSDKNIYLDEFDMLHLVRTIASDVQIFVSRNIHILDIADEIYDKFRLSILSPNNLIIRLEDLHRTPDYQPVRLAGTILKQNRLSIGQEAILNDCYQYYNRGETKAEFQQNLRRFLAEPDKFECSLVIEGEDKLLALIVYGRHKKHELEILMLRVGDNPLSATLTRHIILRSISRSASENRQFTRITDPYLQETVITAICEDTFVKVNNGYLRANLAVAETASQLSIRLTALASQFGEDYNFCQKLAENMNRDASTKDTEFMALIERRLWPAKVTDADIPIFIISIAPKWAIHLFDEVLANQTLFGVKPELAFNREAVYYKSVTNLKQLQAPCRILWYVSGDKSFCGVSEIRACSLVDEVTLGKPKELYQRFQSLGVYKLPDVLNIKPDKDGNIMAIRFSNTELLKYSISLKEIQKILNNKNTFQSPYKIDKNIFETLYNLGMQNQV